MSRILSTIGIGGATVDTVLPSARVSPGETVTADIELEGGSSDHEIDGISLSLHTRVESDGEVEERTLANYEVRKSITLAAGEERSLPIDLEIPEWTPITRGGASVWLETHLSIEWARDPTDEDRLEVVPGTFADALFEAVSDLGFELRYSELVETPYLDDRPIAQEFDFRPLDPSIAADLEELEITVMPRGDDLRVFVEFDQRDEVAAEYDMDFDEQEIPITFETADADRIRRKLKQGIEQHA